MNEQQLLKAARDGDEEAFARLIGPYRRELYAHCYRMLASSADAEDALQDAFLGAWRGLPRFKGRSSLRSWLYTITTNACLRAIERRPKRVLPIDYGPPADPHDPIAEPLVESVWIEPFADAVLADSSMPDARYEQREAVELAFIAAIQRRAAVAAFLAAIPLAATTPRHRLVPTWANGQIAFGHYSRRKESNAFVRHAITVLSLRNTEIEQITFFRSSDAFTGFDLPQRIAP